MGLRGEGQGIHARLGHKILVGYIHLDQVDCCKKLQWACSTLDSGQGRHLLDC